MKSKDYIKGYKKGWQQSLGWINGDFDLLDIPIKYKNAVKAIVVKWLDNWTESNK